jgi:hypothetical protein
MFDEVEVKRGVVEKVPPPVFTKVSSVLFEMEAMPGRGLPAKLPVATPTMLPKSVGMVWLELSMPAALPLL